MKEEPIDFTAYVVKCAHVLLNNGQVTVRTTQGLKEHISNIRWDRSEMIYRFRGELSNQDKCDSFHRNICNNVMLLHLQNAVGIALCKNGSHSVCPLILNRDEIINADDIF